MDRRQFFVISEESVHGFADVTFRFNRSGLVDGADGFEHRVSDDLQAGGAEFVERVLRRVMEDVVVAVIEVDEVGGHENPVRQVGCPSTSN
jgi:hypothetical protein